MLKFGYVIKFILFVVLSQTTPLLLSFRLCYKVYLCPKMITLSSFHCTSRPSDLSRFILFVHFY
jgi:hypothetical protein